MFRRRTSRPGEPRRDIFGKAPITVRLFVTAGVAAGLFVSIVLSRSHHTASIAALVIGIAAGGIAGLVAWIRAE